MPCSIFRSVVWDCESTPRKTLFKPFRPHVIVTKTTGFYLIQDVNNLRAKAQRRDKTDTNIIIQYVISPFFLTTSHFTISISKMWCTLQCICWIMTLKKETETHWKEFWIASCEQGNVCKNCCIGIIDKKDLTQNLRNADITHECPGVISALGGFGRLGNDMPSRCPIGSKWW